MTASKVLLVTRNFPPLWGGMERLNLHLAAELSKRFAVRVIAPQGASQHAPEGVAVREVPLAPLPRFLLCTSAIARCEAHAWQPDLVLAGSGLAAPLAWWAARACNARTAVYVHGLDLAVPHAIYRAFWYPALRRMHQVIANSRATAELAKGIGIAPEKIAIVHPGVDLPAPDPEARARFRASHGIGLDTPVLLSVGRLTARKGLLEFVSDVLPLIACQHPNVLLLVVGDVPQNALYAKPQTPASIQAAADAAGVGKNLRFLSTRFGRELSEAYFAADVHVFPVRDLPNDCEGFGMVAVEAAAHGLPTVAYATGGVVDAVQDGVSGRLVPCGNAQAFARAVLTTLHTPSSIDTMTAYARSLAWSEFGENVSAALLQAS